MLRGLWQRRDPSLHLTIPLAVLAFLVIVVLNVSILAIGDRADRRAAAWEENLIYNGLSLRLKTGMQGEVDMIARMDPFGAMVPPPSLRVLTLDADGTPLLMRAARGARPMDAAALLQAAKPAVADLRTTTAEGSPGIRTGMTIRWMEDGPKLIIAVHSLYPDAGARGVTMIGVTSLTDMANQFARGKLLGGSRLVRLSDLTPGRSVAPLQIMTRKPLVGFEWQPRRIGHETIVGSLPVVWGVSLLLLIAGGLLVWRTLRLARSLVASESHAHHIAMHDPLTGLANRILFTDRLEEALERRNRTGELLAVVCIDLDRFKHVNDTLGHQAGDAMIKEASRRVAGVTRASDTVARLGGDEFSLILFPVADLTALEAVCGRLTKVLSGRVDLPNGQAFLSASIGVTVVRENLDSIDAIRQADLALYRAKQEGRGRFALFEPEMGERLQLRHEIETDLRNALRDGDLDVHYQPQYTAAGELEGVEALVRWTHPTRGPVNPSYFIPIAEEAGLIEQLGQFVMERAIGDAARWPKLKIAINVSPLELKSPGFVARCGDLAGRYGVAPSRIELEITEGVLLENEPCIQAALRALRETGFKLALDDFGTGYSSLSYLHLYPIDKIKVDRSFVSNLGLDADADKVVQAIIHLGRALGLSVTAEGVETQAQRDKLVAAGCHSLQGYLHGRPGAAAEIDVLVRGQAQIKAA